jgi:MFS transporter, DHA3 family, macrolide efflux protein
VTAPVAAVGADRLPPPTRDPVVLVWAGAAFVSFVGDYVWTVALAWTAVHVATPAVAGTVLAAGLVPQALLLLVGGTLADRYDTRRVMVTCNSARIMVMAGGALAWTWGLPAVPVLVVVALLFGVADALYEPASRTLPRQLVPLEHQARLAGIFQIVRRLAAFTGGALGGILAAAYGIVAAMLVNAASFAAIGLVILVVLRPRFPIERDPRESTLRAVRSGIHYVRGNPTVRTLVVALSGLNVFVGPALAVGVALRVSASGWGAEVVGAAEAVLGVGAAAGALLAMRLTTQFPARAGFAALVVQGVAIAGIGIPVMSLLLAACALIGLTAGYASVVLSATFVRMVRPAQLGRVNSMTALTDYTLLPVAMPFFGWLAHTTSIAGAAAAFGAGMVLLSVYAGTRPVVRRLTAEDDAEATSGSPAAPSAA